MQDKTIVIVGGGFAGTTLARPLQPRLPDGWSVLHDGERRLLELPAGLRQAAARALQRRGVAVRLGAKAMRWTTRAWLIWRAYYLSRMPTFGRKLRIGAEWGCSLFFPADITHLRFTRAHELDSPIRNQEKTSC